MQNAASGFFLFCFVFVFFLARKKDLFTYHFIGSTAQVTIFVYSIITGFAFNDRTVRKHNLKRQTVRLLDKIVH